MLDIQKNPYKGGKAKANKVYHLVSNKGYDEDLKRDRVSISATIPSSYMNDNGDLVSWVVSKKVTTAGIEKKILGQITFQHGILNVGSHQKDLMEFLDTCPWNKVNKPKYPKRVTLFSEYDPEAEKEADYESVTQTVDVYRTILALSGSTLKDIARGFGVKTDQHDKYIHIDLINIAEENPVSFDSYMNGNEIKIKILISQATEFQLIERQKNIWQWRSKSTGNYNTICVMPKSVRDPIDFLADHLITPDGSEVREQLFKSISILNGEEKEIIEEPEKELELVKVEVEADPFTDDSGFSE